MSSNRKIITGIIIIAALGMSFYAGAKYDQGKTAAATAARVASFGSGRGTRGAGGAGGTGGAAGGGITAGSIVSSDSQSVTISLRAGGSQIIFYSPDTVITNVASGTPADFTAGRQVVVQGTANSDGSINATGIQVR